MALVPRRLAVTLALFATAAAIVAAVPAAEAARAPSQREAAAIKRVGLKACGAPRECRYGGARVSTRNARFAWANVFAEGFSAVLLKRPRPRSLRFRVIGIQGGGINTCSYWRRRAPRPVLRDLRITGVIGDSGRAHNCG